MGRSTRNARWRYRRATTEIVQRLKRAGVRLIVVGSPGVVDSDAFDQERPNLDQRRGI